MIYLLYVVGAGIALGYMRYYVNHYVMTRKQCRYESCSSCKKICKDYSILFVVLIPFFWPIAFALFLLSNKVMQYFENRAKIKVLEGNYDDRHKDRNGDRYEGRSN